MRWTLDLDDATEETLGETFGKVREMFGNETEIRYRVSGSGKGYHVEWYSVFDGECPDKYRIRESLGDDPLRIQIDKKRENSGLDTNILFDGYWRRGEYFEAGPWRVAV